MTAIEKQSKAPMDKLIEKYNASLAAGTNATHSFMARAMVLARALPHRRF
jgi:hypothetical protein